jgi:hypothetical protein
MQYARLPLAVTFEVVQVDLFDSPTVHCSYEHGFRVDDEQSKQD